MEISFKSEWETKIFNTGKNFMNSSPVKDTIRNVKGIPSSRRKVIPEGNMNLYKEMNRTGNGNCVSKYIFFLI